MGNADLGFRLELMMLRVKDIVTAWNVCVFDRYTDGNLWYEIECRDDGCDHVDFEFPVPIDDTKGGVFHAEEKTITLMRWIRKHLDLMKSEQEKSPDERGQSTAHVPD